MVKKKTCCTSLPSSPRLLFRHWVASLTPRCGSVSTLSKVKGNESPREDGDADRSMAVLGSSAKVAPENDGKGESLSSMRNSCGKDGEMRNPCPVGLIPGNNIKNESLLPLERGHRKIKPVLKDLSEENKDHSVGPASEERSVSSGRYLDKTSFSLGIGVALVLHFAKSENDSNKIIRLQTQLQMLLKDIQDGMCGKDMISNASEGNDLPPISASDSHPNESIDNYSTVQNHEPSDPLVDMHSAVECVEPFLFSSVSENEMHPGMDQLAAELEFELERLEISLGSEASPPMALKWHREMVFPNTAPARSFAARFEESYDHQPPDGEEYRGVHPHELERKLHELLEARQEERIEELEFALERVERKLHEKERQILWWKDNLKGLLQEKQAATGLLGKNKRHKNHNHRTRLMCEENHHLFYMNKNHRNHEL